MKKRAEGKGQGRKSKAAARGGQTGEPGAKPKAKGQKRKGPAKRSTTQEARERAAGLIPSPNVQIVAADPLRAQIVAVAIQRPYSPSEYAREAGVKLNVASYAFKVLKDNHIIELVEAVKVRGATIKHMYRATEAAFISDADWGQLADALQPGMAGVTLQDLNGRLTRAMMTGHFFTREDACLYWAPRDLDEIAWREQAEINRWSIEASEQLEVDTVNRRANGESEGSFHVTFAIAAFPTPTHQEFKEYKAKGNGKRKRPKKNAKGKAAKGKGSAQAKGKGKGGRA
jgi:hypothetical protein